MPYFLSKQVIRISLLFSVLAVSGLAAAAAGRTSSGELALYVSIQGMQARIEHRGTLLAQACRGRSPDIDQVLGQSDQMRVTHRALIEAQILKAREKVQKEQGLEAELAIYQDLKGEQDEAALRFRQSFQLAGVPNEAQCLQALQLHMRVQKEMDEQLN